MQEQVANRHSEIVIGIHQPGRRGDDAVPVGIRVVGECHLVLIFQSDQPRHGIRTRAIHADLAVMIHRHERKGRIDPRVHDGDVELVDCIDRFPIVNGGAAEWIDRELQPRGADYFHVHDVAQILDI
jgi:hypothetical protein